MSAKIAGSGNREAAPSSTDFKQPISRRQIDEATQPPQLLGLSGRQTLVGVFKPRRRIRHRRIQELREQVVAQVIVISDVLATALATVLSPPVTETQQKPPWQRPKSTIDIQQNIPIAHHQAQHRDQIVCIPLASNICLTGTNGTRGR